MSTEASGDQRSTGVIPAGGAKVSPISLRRRHVGVIVSPACTSVGATVSALRRHGLRGLEPDATVVLETGDVVVLLGTAAAVMAGETRLLRG